MYKRNMKAIFVLSLTLLLLTPTCGADGDDEDGWKSNRAVENEKEREELANKKKEHPVYTVPPGQTFDNLKEMGINLRPEERDHVKEYLTNASVLLFKLEQDETHEVNGGSVLDALMSVGRSLISNLPDVSVNETTGKRRELYEGLDITMEIVKQRRETFTGYEFPPFDAIGNNIDACGRESKIRLPKEIFKNSTADVVEIVTLLFEAIPEMESATHRTTKQVNSKILAVSIQPALPFELDETEGLIELTFSKEVMNTNNSDTCVFWEDKAGVFSTTGMTLKSSNESYVVCESRHLTEFAVLSEDSNATAMPTTTMEPTQPENGAGIFLANQLHIFGCLASAIVFVTLFR